MASARKLISFELTPTTAYFFAKLNNILSDNELKKCYIAAVEYVYSSESRSDQHPCTFYIRSTASEGCIIKNDKLSKVKRKSAAPAALMAPHLLDHYYEQKANEAIKDYVYTNLSADDKVNYRNQILDCINPYLQKRAEKFNQFSDQVISSLALFREIYALGRIYRETIDLKSIG